MTPDLVDGQHAGMQSVCKAGPFARSRPFVVVAMAHNRHVTRLTLEGGRAKRRQTFVIDP
jgi:hypothetical protein